MYAFLKVVFLVPLPLTALVLHTTVLL